MNSQWQSTASIKNLKARAAILHQIRHFFSKRDVMEVETPLMCHTSVTDPYIQSIPALYQAYPQQSEVRYYLQTSPEYAMKRLLAMGSGSIYQMGKAFRQGEIGDIHNPEFTMLEWYRINFDHHALMDEVDALLQQVVQAPIAERKTYRDLFLSLLEIDPHLVTTSQLINCAQQHQINVQGTLQHDDWLMLLMSHIIEPKLGHERPCFIYDFPASQAALARIQQTTPPVASRFEVYVRGMELANGFHELQHVAEQRQRFESNLKTRRELNLAEIAIDEYFLAAISHGLPDCAGVALGIDRLVMLATHSTSIKEVISFDIQRA